MYLIYAWLCLLLTTSEHKRKLQMDHAFALGYHDATFPYIQLAIQLESFGALSFIQPRTTRRNMLGLLWTGSVLNYRWSGKCTGPIQHCEAPRLPRSLFASSSLEISDNFDSKQECSIFIAVDIAIVLRFHGVGGSEFQVALQMELTGVLSQNLEG